jgi:Ethylbenzene dehydrogenase/Prokaryotic cytochrome b561
MHVKPRKTDYGTIILHWVLVAAIGVAFFSGLRIATEAPDRAWLNWLDLILPRGSVWVSHMQAAIALVAVAIAHAIYLVRSGLSRRVLLDKIRLRGLIGRKQARLATFSVILTWTFFATLLTLILTGGAMFFGVQAGYDIAMLHWCAAWVVPIFVVLHVLLHFRIGGLSQLSRIFRPERLPPPPPRLDPVELLTLLAEKQSQPQEPQRQELQRQEWQPEEWQPEERQPEEAQHVRPAPAEPHRLASGESRKRAAGAHAQGPVPRKSARRRNVTLQSNPFVVAVAIAITAASAVLAADWLVVDSLRIHRIANADAPILDGDTSDPVWRSTPPLSLLTNQGGNFDGKGESRIDIRAVHDGTWAYFLFTWEDPTRSLKQLPLVKDVDGWHLLHDGYEQGDEHAFNEDKFSVLLTTMDVDLAGDRTFHASPHPLAGAPATMTGRGLHYTTAAGAYADVWQWKATSGGPTGWMDDDHFGPPLEPTPMQVNYAAPYRGGFAHDPGTANYSDNFALSADVTGDNRIVTPRRLPRDLAATTAAMGQITLDPNVGESDGARWFMTEAESVPYSVEQDRLIPVGTVLPGVIIAGEFSGDRADVRCAARWASGHWALEVARRLDTNSQYDVPIKSGVYMRVAAFDHSQIRHTRRVRPTRLEVE